MDESHDMPARKSNRKRMNKSRAKKEKEKTSPTSEFPASSTSDPVAMPARGAAYVHSELISAVHSGPPVRQPCRRSPGRRMRFGTTKVHEAETSASTSLPANSSMNDRDEHCRLPSRATIANEAWEGRTKTLLLRLPKWSHKLHPTKLQRSRHIMMYAIIISVIPPTVYDMYHICRVSRDIHLASISGLSSHVTQISPGAYSRQRLDAVRTVMPHAIRCQLNVLVKASSNRTLQL